MNPHSYADNFSASAACVDTNLDLALTTIPKTLAITLYTLTGPYSEYLLVIFLFFSTSPLPSSALFPLSFSKIKGFEPSTFRATGGRSNHLSYIFLFFSFIAHSLGSLSPPCVFDPVSISVHFDFPHRLSLFPFVSLLSPDFLFSFLASSRLLSTRHRLWLLLALDSLSWGLAGLFPIVSSISFQSPVGSFPPLPLFFLPPFFHIFVLSLPRSLARVVFPRSSFLRSHRFVYSLFFFLVSFPFFFSLLIRATSSSIASQSFHALGSIPPKSPILRRILRLLPSRPSRQRSAPFCRLYTPNTQSIVCLQPTTIFPHTSTKSIRFVDSLFFLSLQFHTIYLRLSNKRIFLGLPSFLFFLRIRFFRSRLLRSILPIPTILARRLSIPIASIGHIDIVDTPLGPK